MRAEPGCTRHLPSIATAGRTLDYQIAVTHHGKATLYAVAMTDEMEFDFPQADELYRFHDAHSQHENRFDRVMGYPRWLRLTALKSGAHVRQQMIDKIEPHQTVLVTASLVPLRRGYIRMRGTRLGLADPLGLVRRQFHFPCAEKILVLPKVYPIPPVQLPSRRLHHQGGVALVSRVGNSHEFFSLRDYQAGDPMRSIHWRSWARSGKPVVKICQDEYFNRYAGGRWSIQDTTTHALTKIRQNRWLLSGSSSGDTDGVLRISTFFSKPDGVLAAPSNSTWIETPHQVKLERNHFGTVMVKNSPYLLEYSLRYPHNGNQTHAPLADDRYIPPLYRGTMQDIVESLGLKNLSERDAAISLQNYFAENFQYTLIQSNRDISYKPLHYFLLNSKKGHCEYFASAGVLLLRAAGIPARYVTGYAMQEYHAQSKEFIVRGRHGHAWISAYINGRWSAWDFTPPQWTRWEAEAAPWWQHANDWLSYGYFQLFHWWYAQSSKSWSIAFAVVTVILTLIYLFGKRNQLRLHWQRQTDHRNTARALATPRLFAPVIDFVQQHGQPRQSGETLKQWVDRQTPAAFKDHAGLLALVQSYYRHRFAESGHPPPAMARQVEHWLARETQTTNIQDI